MQTHVSDEFDNGYYQTYIDMTNEILILDQNTKIHMGDVKFRKTVASKHVDARLVKEIAPYLKPTLYKPQKPIIIDENYYVACDILSRTMYVCYKHLLMIDIDNYKDNNSEAIELKLPHCLCQVKQVINDWTDQDEVSDRKVLWKNKICNCKDKKDKLRYRIYKSRNGYHIFLISHKMTRDDDISIQLAIECMSDYFYVIYSYIRGWCVRLNRKPNETSASIYEYYSDVVDGRLLRAEDECNLTTIIPELEAYVKLHISLANVFKSCEPCNTKNVA